MSESITIGIDPGIRRYIEALIDEAGSEAKQGPTAVLLGGDSKEDRIASFLNWAVTYIIATLLHEKGLDDERVNDYVLRLVKVTEEDEA